MLKSEILLELGKKYKNFKPEEVESIFDLFIKKITNSLKEDKNIELRGFGTISKKINKEKFI